MYVRVSEYQLTSQADVFTLTFFFLWLIPWCFQLPQWWGFPLLNKSERVHQQPWPTIQMCCFYSSFLLLYFGVFWTANHSWNVMLKLNQPGFGAFEFWQSTTCQRVLLSKSKGHRQEWLWLSHIFLWVTSCGSTSGLP